MLRSWAWRRRQSVLEDHTVNITVTGLCAGRRRRLGITTTESAELERGHLAGECRWTNGEGGGCLGIGVRATARRDDNHSVGHQPRARDGPGASPTPRQPPRRRRARSCTAPPRRARLADTPLLSLRSTRISAPRTSRRSCRSMRSVWPSGRIGGRLRTFLWSSPSTSPPPSPSVALCAGRLSPRRRGGTLELGVRAPRRRSVWHTATTTTLQRESSPKQPPGGAANCMMPPPPLIRRRLATDGIHLWYNSPEGPTMVYELGGDANTKYYRARGRAHERLGVVLLD